MRKHDVSIHFTLKGQSMEEVNEKIDIYFKEGGTEVIDFSEADENGVRTVLHHCFLPRHIVEEKGLDTSLIDSLDEIGGENQVCWYYASDLSLGMSRLLMLQNLKRLNGVAWFIGNITDGVLEEYRLAEQLGLDIIQVP